MSEHSDGLRIWNQVEITDPEHTKKTTFGRKFTAIDAMSQIKEATRIFGPIGDGWQYNAEYYTEEACFGEHRETLMFCEILFFWTDPETGKINNFGPVCGCNPLFTKDKNGNIRLDDDAPKKAMTDAITKALSQLGFNADVFLGYFDDNKYIQNVREKLINRRVGDSVTALQVAIRKDDPAGALEVWLELGREDQEMVWKQLNTKEKATARELFTTARGESVEETENHGT